MKGIRCVLPFTSRAPSLSSSVVTPNAGARDVEFAREDLVALHALARATVLRGCGIYEETGSKGVRTLRSSLVDTILTQLQKEMLSKPSALDSLTGGSFVTLKDAKSSALRGCVGITEQLSLPHSVVASSVYASIGDDRFSPVHPSELSSLLLKVSLLSPCRPIAEVWREFVLGKHGITLTKKGHRALYLPEVPPEQGWDTEATLLQLCLKAGLPSNAWKEGCQFEVFTSQIYEAPCVQ